MPAGSGWKDWITGKALPLAWWTLFLVMVLRSLSADVVRLSREGARPEAILLLSRGGLTAAFMVLLAAAYLTRIRAAERARGFRERVFPLLVFVASIAGVGLLQSRAGPSRPTLAGAGLLLAPLGLCLSIWSVWHLRSSFSIMAEARRTVDSGPYRFVRHPLYLGEALTLLGLCLMIGTGTALLFWAIISGLQLARARIEERKLALALPDYEAYRRRTPFILPYPLGRSR